MAQGPRQSWRLSLWHGPGEALSPEAGHCKTLRDSQALWANGTGYNKLLARAVEMDSQVTSQSQRLTQPVVTWSEPAPRLLSPGSSHCLASHPTPGKGRGSWIPSSWPFPDLP